MLQKSNWFNIISLKFSFEDDNVEKLSQMGFGLEEEDLRLALTLYSNNVNIAVVALTQEVKDRKDEEITPPSPPSPLSVSISSAYLITYFSTSIGIISIMKMNFFYLNRMALLMTSSELGMGLKSWDAERLI